MRGILIVLGAVIVAFGVSVLLTQRKDLTPRPQDRLWAKQEADMKKDAEKVRAQLAKQQGSAAKKIPTFEIKPNSRVLATLTVKGKGTVEIELYPKEAGETVQRFADLVNSGFYNGIAFHRVVPDFVAQAGDPQSRTMTPQDFKARDDGQGGTLGLGGSGSGQFIRFERNNLKHEAGTVAMALSEPRSDTGDSQFFINLKNNDSLNENYCVFGRVISGMDVVMRIARGDIIEKFTVRCETGTR
jgi:cyclophilin family peptidyl-prolyl cis-trans isomerase